MVSHVGLRRTLWVAGHALPVKLFCSAAIVGLGIGASSPASRNACMQLAPDEVPIITGLAEHVRPPLVRSCSLQWFTAILNRASRSRTHRSDIAAIRRGICSDRDGSAGHARSRPQGGLVVDRASRGCSPGCVAGASSGTSAGVDQKVGEIGETWRRDKVALRHTHGAIAQSVRALSTDNAEVASSIPASPTRFRSVSGRPAYAPAKLPEPPLRKAPFARPKGQLVPTRELELRRTDET